MRFEHIGCGGEIDTRAKQCLKCKHKWSYLAFMFTPYEIRQIKETPSAIVKPSKFDWMTPENVARHLPKWPKWVRVLSVVVVLALVVALIIWIRSVL